MGQDSLKVLLCNYRPWTTGAVRRGLTAARGYLVLQQHLKTAGKMKHYTDHVNNNSNKKAFFLTRQQQLDVTAYLVLKHERAPSLRGRQLPFSPRRRSVAGRLVFEPVDPLARKDDIDADRTGNREWRGRRGLWSAHPSLN